MKNKPIIAVAQIKYFDVCKSHNVDKIKKYIRLAKKANADIICFPESCVHKREFLYMNHRLISEIQEECRKNSIWCIINDHITIKGKDYNMSLLIDRKGKIKGHYKKIHLYGDEVTPGRKIKVFKTDFAKIGIVICWDIAFPDLFQKMRKMGAEIIFCPAKWWYETEAHDKEHQKREIKILESLIRVRAYENRCFVALCNPVLDSKYQISYSGIACPHRILKEIINKEGMITAQLDFKELKKIRKIYKS